MAMTQSAPAGEFKLMMASRCTCCEADAKSKSREFSPQVWSILLAWEEIEQGVVGQPICEDCYQDIRGILIDRADEMELAITKGIINKPEVIPIAKKQAAPEKKKTKPVAKAPKKKQVTAKRASSKAKPAKKAKAASKSKTKARKKTGKVARAS